jgi:hypothetical protein
LTTLENFFFVEVDALVVVVFVALSVFAATQRFKVEGVDGSHRSLKNKIYIFWWKESKLMQISQFKQDLLGQVSRLRKREEQIPPLEWVGPEVR